jgi:hypothetical protein
MADQQEPSSFFSSITPTVWVSLLAAVLALVGTLRVASNNAAAQRELEREQFESNLILKAISTGDKKQSFDNLRFLVESHLIRQESDKVSQLLQDSSFHFHIARDSSEKSSHLAGLYSSVVYPDPTISGVVVDDSTSQLIQGVTVSTKTRRSRMRNIKSQLTSSDGRFNIPYPPRTYFLNFTHPGYIEQRVMQSPGYKMNSPVLIIRMKRY